MPYLIDLSGTEKYSVLSQWDNKEGQRVEDYVWRGDPVPPDRAHMKPTELQLNKKKGMQHPPDIFGTSRRYVVSERIKTLIETLEPGKHRFVPIALRWIRLSGPFGQNCKLLDRIDASYFMLTIGNISDCIMEEESSLHVTRLEAYEGGGEFVQIDTFGHHALDKTSIEGLHLWKSEVGRGRLMLSYDYCSDELREQILALDAKGWRFKKVKLFQRW